MVYKRRPDGDALGHHAEVRAAGSIVYYYRGPLFANGLDLLDIKSEIVVHLLAKKHLYEPANEMKASYKTWCWSVARHYCWRLIGRAENRRTRMAGWHQASPVYEHRFGEQEEVCERLIATSNLSDRQRAIVCQWLSGKTLEEMAKDQPRPVTRERVRQILGKAMKTIKQRAAVMASNARCTMDELFLGAA
jgi:RNA polymerase sigma factor (sigma-70 family)